MLKTTASLVVALALLATTRSNAQSLTACSADKLKNAMKACDSLVNISQIKCDTTACHKALHVLTDPDYMACYEELKMGSKNDLKKYKDLDDFCHGEAPDPLDAKAASGAADEDVGPSTAGDANASNATVTKTPPAPASTSAQAVASTKAPTAASSSASFLTGSASALSLAIVGVASFVF